MSLKKKPTAPFSWVGSVVRFATGLLWRVHYYPPNVEVGIFGRTIRRFVSSISESGEGGARTPSPSRGVFVVVRITRVDSGITQVIPVYSAKFGKFLQSIHSKVLRDIKTRLTGSVMEAEKKRYRAAMESIMSGKRSYAVAVQVLLPGGGEFSEDSARRSAETLPASVIGASPVRLVFPAAHNWYMDAVDSGEIHIPRSIWTGKIPLYMPRSYTEEDYPVLVGVSDSGALVTIALGRLGQASHILIFGMTGSGKSVTAKTIVYRACRRPDVRAVIVDVKGEMTYVDESGEERGIFGFKVLNPVGQGSGIMWNFPSSLEIFQQLASFNGDVRGVLDQAEASILIDASLVTGLLSGIAGARISAADFHTAYRKWLANQVLSNPRAVEAIRKEGAVWLARLGTKFLTAFLQKSGVSPESILGKDAPFRNLIAPDSLIDVEDNVVINLRSLGALVRGDVRDDLLNLVYPYAINYIVARIGSIRRGMVESGIRRHIIYLEEMHRLPSGIAEQLVRMMRSYDVSIVGVSQSTSPKDVSPEAMEQFKYVIGMAPRPSDIRETVSRMGGLSEIPIETLISHEPYGRGVLFQRYGSRCAVPISMRVVVEPQLLRKIKEAEAYSKKKADSAGRVDV